DARAVLGARDLDRRGRRVDGSARGRSVGRAAAERGEEGEGRQARSADEHRRPSSIVEQRRYLRAVIVQQRIASKLTSALSPVHLDVVNESHQHSVPPGSETHFKVLVVSPAFEGRSLIERHRAVNAALADELKGGVHALTIRALTPAQWEGGGAEGFASPPCLGGSKNARA